MCTVLQEIVVQPASKKSKLTPSRPLSGLSPEASTRRALANGATTAVPVSSSTPVGTITKPSDVFVNRLSEHAAAAETNEQTTPLVKKPSIVEAKALDDVLPQNSAVVAPALSHSAKVKFNTTVHDCWSFCYFFLMCNCYNCMHLVTLISQHGQ